MQVDHDKTIGPSSIAVGDVIINLANKEDPSAQSSLRYIEHCVRHHNALLNLANEYNALPHRRVTQSPIEPAVSGKLKRIQLADPTTPTEIQAIKHLSVCTQQHPALLRIARQYFLESTLGDTPAEKCEELLKVVSDASAVPVNPQRIRPK